MLRRADVVADVEVGSGGFPVDRGGFVNIYLGINIIEPKTGKDKYFFIMKLELPQIVIRHFYQIFLLLSC